MSWSIRLNSMLGNLPPNGRFSRQILESALNLPAENGRWKIYLPFRLFETGVKWKILGEMADLRIYILYETQLKNPVTLRTPVRRGSITQQLSLFYRLYNPQNGLYAPTLSTVQFHRIKSCAPCLPDVTSARV